MTNRRGMAGISRSPNPVTLRRNASALAGAPFVLGQGLQYDRTQKVSIKPGRRILDPTGTTELDEKVREILAVMRGSGFLEK